MKIKDKRLLADLALICSVILAATAILAVIYLSAGNGGTAVVELDGEVIGRYPLTEDAEIRIPSKQGFNLLVIENGKARVSEADCPDGICTDHFPVSREGEVIVCLPHKLVIYVESD